MRIIPREKTQNSLESQKKLRSVLIRYRILLWKMKKKKQNKTFP